MSRDRISAFLLGAVVSIAAMLWCNRARKAEVFFDPLNDPEIVQATVVTHVDIPTDPRMREKLTREMRFCQSGSIWHFYPCRCGIVKP